MAPSRRTVIVGAAAGFALLLAVVIAFYIASPRGFAYPESLPGGAVVVQVVEGDRAVEAVRGIHWSPERIRVEDAAIILYSDGTRLWLVRAGDACSLVEAMARKMVVSEERLPYTAPMQHRVAGVEAYISIDKRTGRPHVFWCRDSLVAWVELGPAVMQNPMEAIKLLVSHTS